MREKAAREKHTRTKAARDKRRETSGDRMRDKPRERTINPEQFPEQLPSLTHVPLQRQRSVSLLDVFQGRVLFQVEGGVVRSGRGGGEEYEEEEEEEERGGH